MTDQTAPNAAQQMHEAADILRQFALAFESGNTAALHPGVVALFAHWLDCLSVAGPAGQCEWCDGDHAATVARSITGLARATGGVASRATGGASA